MSQYQFHIASRSKIYVIDREIQEDTRATETHEQKIILGFFFPEKKIIRQRTEKTEDK